MVKIGVLYATIFGFAFATVFPLVQSLPEEIHFLVQPGETIPRSTQGRTVGSRQNKKREKTRRALKQGK